MSENLPTDKNGSTGNDNAVLFPTPEARQAACQAYVDHIRLGFSKYCFDLCDHETIDKYIREFPEDFDLYKIEAAFRVGRRTWEQRGHDLVDGRIDGNASTWFRIMQNQYDYRNRYDVTSEDEPVKAKVIDLSQLTEKQLDKLADILASAEIDNDE